MKVGIVYWSVLNHFRPTGLVVTYGLYNISDNYNILSHDLFKKTHHICVIICITRFANSVISRDVGKDTCIIFQNECHKIITDP